MNPRIVVLTTYFRPVVGGVESNAERFARYLHATGFPVRVVTKRVTRDLPDIDDLGGVRVDRIGPFGERNASGKWRFLPAAIAWLVRHQSDYDVVCGIDYRGIGIAAIAARALTGRRVVLQAQTPGGLNPGGMKGPAIAVYRRADAFACISHALEAEVRSAGVADDRVHFLPNPVDMTRFRAADPSERLARRQAMDLPPDAVVFLFVGRLSREKGLMDLMEAWRLAAPTGAMLLVAGPDMVNHPWDVGSAARSFADAHGLNTSVRFLGSVDDVAALLRVADVVVQPSHFEAQGLSAVEALASGAPVIASSVGGLLDFIVDRGNGLLTPPQDPSALARCIRLLLDDPGLRMALAAAARASVAEQYDERVVFARFAGLLRQIAAGTT